MNVYTLITGASGVFGGEFARYLARRGENLLLTGRNAQKLGALKKELDAYSTGDIEIFAADLNAEAGRKSLFAFARGRSMVFGKLINVAGADVQKAFKAYTPEKIVFQTRINFEAAVAVTHEALSMRTENFGVLTVSSLCGTSPMPYFALYSATKGALINFFTALRYEYKDVKFTVLAPGSIPTRDDVKEDIRLQGLTGMFSSKTPLYVVKRGIRGLEKNKRLVIPGLYNKLVYFFGKITPEGIKCRVIAKKFSIKTKDAF
ncbi:MAG: SDR family NAD(P)-dependent oxidoreductase [Clostridia bacterium]|nr:SDR family NAD(P)-dependent oxidoreductase [Clostridia bacterium]